MKGLHCDDTRTRVQHDESEGSVRGGGSYQDARLTPGKLPSSASSLNRCCTPRHPESSAVYTFDLGTSYAPNARDEF